jgi:hypothetical protein
MRTGTSVTVQLHPAPSLGLMASAPPASKEDRMEQTSLGLTPNPPLIGSRLATFSQLQPVAVGILEHCDIGERVLKHLRFELHAA